MYNPDSSYRIQFNRSFTFKDLEKYINYLNKLGVGSIYASPVFAAVPGSKHGYDVTDPGMINPELGTMDDLSRLTRLLKESGMGWIQDIVPNHMAYHTENRWIRDVLEKGPDSGFFRVFDTEPSVAVGTEKIMLPFLGSDPDHAVRNLELQVCLHDGSLALRYFDNIFPANFDSFKRFFEPHIDIAPDCFRLIWNRHELGSRIGDKTFLNGDWEMIKEEIESFCKTDPGMLAWTARILKKINTDPARIRVFIDGQHYEPCHWKEASRRINYRRFFTVGGLVCIRIEDKAVMDEHHGLIFELIEGGHIQGLRVDHVDGLRVPAEYLKRLRSAAGEKTFIVVEKILEKGEKIPKNWPVQGSSGYDYLALVNNLMVSKKGYIKLDRFYRQFTGETDSPSDIVYRNKKLILSFHMQGELDNVCRRFESLFSYAEKAGIAAYNEKKGITRETMKQAIGEFMLAFPVYRLYPEEYPLTGETRKKVGEIFNIAIKRNNLSGKSKHSGRGLNNAIILLRDLVLQKRITDDKYYSLLKEFFGRLMQYAGPLTAKGVEDTSMYRYNSFIAGNEVGDSIGPRGMDNVDFHHAMSLRLLESPLSMNCTSTHDTKRGEDVRARLNAIGDLPDEWIKLVREWQKMNLKLKREISIPANPSGNSPDSGPSETVTAPSHNEEYFIYQTIAGTFPFDENACTEYTTRISEYLVKALREAKHNSSWEDPDEQYEKAVCDFAKAILDPNHGFLKSFLPFHRKLAWRGIVNSLSQLALKCCSPGMPDIYRGTEKWDLSLVDPDNRREVNLEALNAELGEISMQWQQKPSQTIATLYRNAPDGRIKLLLTSILLNERRYSPDIFLNGEYIPVKTGGRFGDNVLGFARKWRDQWLLCIIPVRSGKLSSERKGEHFTSIRWKDTFIELPAGAPHRWKNITDGRTFEADENIGACDTISAAGIFSHFPVAVLRSEINPSSRKAGILMHISSLPGEYGIGDLGEEACRFADFLSQTFQTYWQTLPLSPVTGSQSWSPYSSPSSFAGNTLLVSPAKLYVEGLISGSDLDMAGFKNSSRVCHKKAAIFRKELLEKAWERLRQDAGNYLFREYEKFCANESYWLDDYTLFLACKENYGGREWNKWPAGLKNRDEKTLKTASYEFAGKIMQEKFNQFIFYRQWRKLKEYANKKGILIFGDIPFYVSYDSAEVWASRHLFNLDEKGRMKTVAGVPPDYFDKNGQLWNMPVYDWNRMKESGYDWWLKRLAKNLELFDLLRLDHFRAFSAYWEVPAKDKTAINGRWSRGPGSEFFDAVQSAFPSMPFVAEDLGDIDQDVYDLRDHYSLPGMQVLQFTFDRNMATNIHTPHNHSVNSLVYTGTHDNNTLRGWYDRELDRAGKKRFQEYAGKKIRASEASREIIRMVFASPAATAIVPMQDYMGLGREARMNTPSTSGGNWLWKMRSMDAGGEIAGMIRKLTIMYNRR